MAHQIALIPGDGIGKEVVKEGVRLLELLNRTRQLALEWRFFDLGADRFLKDGATFPAEDQAWIKEKASAVLLGALGDPRVPDLGYARDILFGLRFGLDLYCNLRPVVCLSDRLMPLKGKDKSHCNMVVFRENTEGVYVGIGGNFKKGTPDEVAINEDVNTRKGVERIIRAAFDYAIMHQRKRVHMADKSNAMQFAHGLWQRTFAEVAKEYPSIDAKHMYVDAMCLQMVRAPEMFDVVVTNNLFGDIITDLGAALQGGLGMAASANVRPMGIGVFEPVHGSAPDIAGRNLANPFATFLSIGMMMTHLGFKDLEALIMQAVTESIDVGECTADIGGNMSTTEVSDKTLSRIERRL